MSSIDLDGSHTTALHGGECQSYQGRKKRKTTNAIYVTDRQGIPLAMSTPVAGSRNDLYNISEVVKEVFSQLAKSDVSIDGLFLNADAGYDAKSLFPCRLILQPPALVIPKSSDLFLKKRMETPRCPAVRLRNSIMSMDVVLRNNTRKP